MNGQQSNRDAHSFYQLPVSTQWLVAILMALLLLTLIVFWSALVYEYIWAYLSIVFIAPFMQFLATPLLTLAGVYRYLSPMLLVYMPTSQRYDLHNGTSFDYLFIMRSYGSGGPLRHQLLRFYLKGLMAIIEKIESGDVSENVLIRGSSYFFSERTAKKLGFHVRKASFLEQLNIAINYLDLLWMYSLAHGKLTFPKLNRIKTAEIKGHTLLQHKEILQSQYKNLKGVNR